MQQIKKKTPSNVLIIIIIIIYLFTAIGFYPVAVVILNVNKT